MQTNNRHIRLQVIVKPLAHNTRILGVTSDNTLKIAVAAPPVDGAANKALIKFIAKLLHIRQQDVIITHGLTHSHKTLNLPLSTAETLQQLLDNIPQ